MSDSIKRLKKIADQYTEPENRPKWGERLKDAAEFYCNSMRIDPSTIDARNESVSFGAEDGMVEVRINNDGTLNEIIARLPGCDDIKGEYSISEDSNLLRAFFNHSYDFQDWLENELDKLEQKMFG